VEKSAIVPAGIPHTVFLKFFSFSKSRQVRSCQVHQKDDCKCRRINLCSVSIRGPYTLWPFPLPLHQDWLENRDKIMSISTNNIIVWKLDYHESHFTRARRFVFDDTCGLYETAVNRIQHTFRTSRVLLCNSLGTSDLPKLSAIWIWRGPWNCKFSAPSSPSSRLENWVHPPKIGLNLNFCSEKSVTFFALPISFWQVNCGRY